MTSIIYVGMDVHTTNYTLCCYSIETNQAFAQVQVDPDYKEILRYLNQVQSQRGGYCKFICGYEAGGLGYSLYHELSYHGIECVILAPSTMAVIPGKRIKTDARDAEHISKCLAYHTYSSVHIPSQEDDAVKEYDQILWAKQRSANGRWQNNQNRICGHGAVLSFRVLCVFDGKNDLRKSHKKKQADRPRLVGIVSASLKQQEKRRGVPALFLL